MPFNNIAPPRCSCLIGRGRSLAASPSDTTGLDERVWREARIAVLPGTGRNLRPVQGFHLDAREPEHELARESFLVAFDLLVQALGGNAVERGEVRIAYEA
jgi:hypothetical protein